MVEQIDISTYQNFYSLLLHQWQEAVTDILDMVALIKSFLMCRYRSPFLTGKICELIRHRDYLAKPLKNPDQQL